MYVCHDVNAPLWVCHDVNVLMVHAMMRMQPCRYATNANAPLWVYHDTNALMQTQFIQKFLLFSKRGFHNAWNQNIFKPNLLFLKSHLPFDLRLPKKNWWSLLENLRMGHLLEIWWSGSKRLIFTIWLSKEMAHFQGLFLEKWILWKSSILKRFIFFSSWIWQFDKRQDPPW